MYGDLFGAKQGSPFLARLKHGYWRADKVKNEENGKIDVKVYKI